MEPINTARSRVWKKMPRAFLNRVVIDIAGTIAGTTVACKDGMDMSYKGI